jgi:hypothetical protein
VRKASYPSKSQDAIHVDSAGKHVLLADLRQENADAAAKTLSDAGFSRCVIARFGCQIQKPEQRSCTSVSPRSNFCKRSNASMPIHG